MQDFIPDMMTLAAAEDMRVAQPDDIEYVAADIELTIAHLQTIVKSLRAGEVGHAFDYFQEHRYDIDNVGEELITYYWELEEQTEWAMSDQEFDPDEEHDEDD